MRDFVKKTASKFDYSSIVVGRLRDLTNLRRPVNKGSSFCILVPSLCSSLQLMKMHQIILLLYRLFANLRTLWNSHVRNSLIPKSYEESITLRQNQGFAKSFSTFKKSEIPVQNVPEKLRSQNCYSSQFIHSYALREIAGVLEKSPTFQEKNHLKFRAKNIF